MIGQYPQQTPEQEPVAVIHKLSEGYVLVIRGRTYACPSIHALSQAISKQFKQMEQEPVVQPTVVVDDATAQSWLEQVLHPQAEPTDKRAQQPFASPDEQMILQRHNLAQSARALVDQRISEEDFQLARQRFFPDIDEETVLNVAQSMGWASSKVSSNSFQQPDPVPDSEPLRPEPPDPDGDDDDFDPDVPVQVVDLGAGREGRRKAREQR